MNVVDSCRRRSLSLATSTLQSRPSPRLLCHSPNDRHPYSKQHDKITSSTQHTVAFPGFKRKGNNSRGAFIVSISTKHPSLKPPYIFVMLIVTVQFLLIGIRLMPNKVKIFARNYFGYLFLICLTFLTFNYAKGWPPRPLP